MEIAGGTRHGASKLDLIVVADNDDVTGPVSLPLRRLLGPRTRRVACAGDLRACLRGNAGVVVVADAHARCMDIQEAQSIVREVAPDASFLIVDSERSELRRRLAVCDRLVSLGTVVAQVAHEINNPLQSAVLNVDFALDLVCGRSDWEPERRKEIASALEDARSAMAQALTIASDLRTLSRVDEGLTQVVDVRPILDSALLVTAHETRKRARVIRSYEAMPYVSASAARLRQVFVNVLVNAAQAIPEGAPEENSIRVSTSTDEHGRAVIAVRDTGIGMSADVAAKVFYPFFTTKPPGVGTGLGLAICHDIVTGLGGEIEVHSEPSRGTELRIVLPPSPPDAEQAGQKGDP